MTENEMKLEARLAAVEYMIGHTLKLIYGRMGVTGEVLDLNQQQGGRAGGKLHNSRR